MDKKTARAQIILGCSICKRHNYHTEKNKIKTTKRLELNKYCRFCRKVTLHQEKK